MILKFTKECVWNLGHHRGHQPIFACRTGAIISNLPIKAQQEMIDGGYAVKAPVQIALDGSETLVEPLSEDFYTGYV